MKETKMETESKKLHNKLFRDNQLVLCIKHEQIKNFWIVNLVEENKPVDFWGYLSEEELNEMIERENYLEV